MKLLSSFHLKTVNLFAKNKLVSHQRAKHGPLPLNCYTAAKRRKAPTLLLLDSLAPVSDACCIRRYYYEIAREFMNLAHGCQGPDAKEALPAVMR